MQTVLPKQADVTLSQALNTDLALNVIAQAAVLMLLRQTSLHSVCICICIVCHKELGCVVHHMHQR